MASLLKKIKNNFHPLHRLRSTSLGRFLLRWLDFPIWISLPGIPFTIRVNIFRNASYLADVQMIEPEVRLIVDTLLFVYSISYFWDVGANVGYYSYYVKSRTNLVEAVAFEPDPGNLANISATIKRHSLGGLQVSSKAVSESSGKKSFHLDVYASVTGSLVDPDGVIGRKIHGDTSDVQLDVEATTLDLEVEVRGLPDLLKIDVEGAELHVIQGGSNLLADNPPILIMECKRENLSEALMTLQQGYGGNIFFIGDPSHTHPNILALPLRLHKLNSAFIAICNNKDYPLYPV